MQSQIWLFDYARRVGTGAGTLGKITASASGTVSVSGTAAGTLKAIYVSGESGNVIIDGFGNAQFTSIYVSAGSGNVSVVGSASATFQAIYVSAGSGDVSDVGSASGTLRAITGQGSGLLEDVGSANALFNAIYVSLGSGDVSVVGTASASLGAIINQAEGDVSVTGTGSGTLGAITGQGGVLGQGNGQFQGIYVSVGIGDVSVIGSASATLGAIYVSLGSGFETITGTATCTLGRIRGSASGTVSVTGTAAGTLGRIKVTGQPGSAAGTLGKIYGVAFGIGPCPPPEQILNVVSLACPLTGTSIVLPVPEFSDTEAAINQKTVAKRSMNNVLKTYVRRNDTHRLIYSFHIGRPLSLFLRTFIDTNIGNRIIMENWTGEVWGVYITNNPVEFTAKSRFEPEGEQYEVRMEFQGVRLV